MAHTRSCGVYGFRRRAGRRRGYFSEDRNHRMKSFVFTTFVF